MTKPDDDMPHVDIKLPDFDPAIHAGAMIEPEDVPAPKDLPVVMGKDHRAPELYSLGGNTYYQHRGDHKGWPDHMSDQQIDHLVRCIGKLWKSMWQVHRQGTKDTLGEIGTVLISQCEVLAGEQVHVNYVPKRDAKGPLVNILHTIGTPNYDHIHDMHVSVALDAWTGIPFHPAAEIKVLIIANAKTDDEV
jgi:hypothetical protein